MAYRDQDGNLISADATDISNEHNLEKIPEEKVSQLCFHFFSIHSLIVFSELMSPSFLLFMSPSFFSLDKSFSFSVSVGHEIRGFFCPERKS